MSQLLRAQTLFPLLATLTAIGASTYHLDRWSNFIYEENEARMDEIEGTLRGHIGLVFCVFWEVFACLVGGFKL